MPSRNSSSIKRNEADRNDRSSSDDRSRVDRTREAIKRGSCIRWRVASNGYVIGYSGGKMFAQHREVWKAKHGKIPAGHHVHHIDGNKSNNDISNLRAMPRREHIAMHPQRQYATTCTECGKIVVYKRSFKGVCKSCQYKRADKQRMFTRTCRQCGAQFISRRGGFCSQRCVNLGGRWKADRLQSNC